MQQSARAEIVIPTGRNSYCCIVPCALMCGFYDIGGIGAAVLVWRYLRRRARR